MGEKILNFDTAFPLMEKFDKEVFKKVFPKSTYLQAYHLGRIVGKFNYKGLFDNTNYKVSIDESFIHFTSLQALTSILNNGFFRLSEFRHFEDIEELHYASKIFSDIDSFKPNEENINDQKENCFALSACLKTENTLKNSFMWEKYGNKGKGVIIQFKLNYDKIFKFLLGKVQYGEEGLKNITYIKELAEKFRVENDGFYYDEFPERIMEFLAFHKQDKYLSENEVRFFFNEKKRKYDKHNHESIYEDITANNEVRYFFKTFLTERKSVLEREINNKEISNQYFELYPTIEIENIILGNNLDIKRKVEIFQLLSVIKTKYKYNFELHQLTDEDTIQEFR
ncbi:DUF2971 domain-containing protein [Thalassobellus suaedae]|uniref:DUF2971 domain-containing protein n=1 Tax=Thalassobellus suaedae TaxID=3074124 RepID=A0ABY9Y533_9FLAO|nr:DUF2971 domain-containing protein [Flavobacteriaceae bacterium HL-DH10]